MWEFVRRFETVAAGLPARYQFTVSPMNNENGRSG